MQDPTITRDVLEFSKRFVFISLRFHFHIGFANLLHRSHEDGAENETILLRFQIKTHPCNPDLDSNTDAGLDEIINTRLSSEGFKIRTKNDEEAILI